MMMRVYSIFLLLLVLVSCKPEVKKAPPAPVDVTDYTVEAQTIPAIFDFIGFAESSHTVEIRAKVEGYLDRIAYEEGSLVQEGSLLFQLDPRQYEAKVAQARGEVARQKALLENANLTVKRLSPLYEQKAASRKDLDNAIAQQLALEASLLSAQANLLDSEINLGYTTITTPVTGLADKAKYREGALINPGTNSLMTTVSVLDPIWVYFSVSDNDITRMKQQQTNDSIVLPKSTDYKVKLIQSNGVDYPFVGKVNFNAPTYDQSTGSMLVRAVFPNPDEQLRPGEFVRVKVYGAFRPNALIVPRRAIMQKKSGIFVYLIDKDNQVVAQDISGDNWYGDYQIISNGLKPGDRIIVDGINKVRPGSVINVKNTWVPPADPNTTPSKER